MVTLGTTYSENFISKGIVLFVLKVCTIFPSSPCASFLRAQAPLSLAACYAAIGSSTPQGTPFPVFTCGGSHALNIKHGVEPSLITLITVPWVSHVFDLKPPWLSSSRAGEMHPGPLASAGDGCFAGQGDSARLMLVFFWEKSRCWDGIVWDYVINNSYMYIYILYILANSMVCMYSWESSYMVYTFYTCRWFMEPRPRPRGQGHSERSAARRAMINFQPLICHLICKKTLNNEHWQQISE